MSNPSENSIDQLISLVSHELRTPITCLQGAIELLQSYQQADLQNEPSELSELLTLAAESTDRLTHVIENILDWYEITQSTKGLYKQPCNVTFLLQQVVAALRPFVSDRQIHINLETPASIPVYADQYHLSRALSHLIHNAIKFSQPDRQIDITATLVQQDGGQQDAAPVMTLPYVLIAIQDQGIGIPETALEQIFQPFHQVDTSDDRSYGGLGLELAICREVIRHHQGKIWAKSQVGQGSTFYVALPIDESAGF